MKHISNERSKVSLSTVQYVAGRSTFAGWHPARATDRLIDAHIQTASHSLYRKDLRAHFGCVNAIEFSNGAGELIASGGDDRRVLLWNVEKALSDVGSPAAMTSIHDSNVFCLAFTASNKNVISGGNDCQVLVHDVQTREALRIYRNADAIYSLSADPINENIFASACDDGKVHIYDIRTSDDPFLLVEYETPMQAVVYNPVETRLLATANSGNGVGLWDIRKPKCCLQHYGHYPKEEFCMSVRFNQLGDHLLVLRRRKLPILYRIDSPKSYINFNHNGYRNSCTMKSCTFAGDRDQYILSGSDDFNLYMWEIPSYSFEESEHCCDALMVLQGHRSIVNQVRYNKLNSLIISSGVEKLIKVWSPFQLPGCSDQDVSSRSLLRGGRSPIHMEFIDMMTHDYSHQSTDEDPHMLAFFDQLVQQEDGGWSPNESTDSEEQDTRADPNPRRRHDSYSSAVMVFYRAGGHSLLVDGDVSSSEDDEPEIFDTPLRSVYEQQLSATRRNGNEAFQIESSSSSESSDSSSTTSQLDLVIPIRTYSSGHDPSSSTSSSSATSTRSKSSPSHGRSGKTSSPLLSSTSSTVSSSADSDSDSPVYPSSSSKSARPPVSSVQLSRCRESLNRLKRLRQCALNSDDDNDGEEHLLMLQPKHSRIVVDANPSLPNGSQDARSDMLADKEETSNIPNHKLWDSEHLDSVGNVVGCSNGAALLCGTSSVSNVENCEQIMLAGNAEQCCTPAEVNHTLQNGSLNGASVDSTAHNNNKICNAHQRTGALQRKYRHVDKSDSSDDSADSCSEDK